MMKDTLKHFLDRLDAIGAEHEELFDSDVRQKMRNAVMDGFVRRRTGFGVPYDLGMYSEEANAAVAMAISEFIETANQQADELKIIAFHDRLNVVQDGSVRSDLGNDYDEFLGHSPAEYFDDVGNVIRTR